MNNNKLPTTLKQSCKKLGYDAATVLPDVSNMPAHLQDNVLAFAEMLINSEAMQDGFQADYQNLDQPKWTPYFDLNKGADNPKGFRFWLAFVGRAHAYAPGGSAFALPSSEVAEHSGTAFAKTWQRVITRNKK